MFDDEIKNPLSFQKQEVGLGNVVHVLGQECVIVEGYKKLLSATSEEFCVRLGGKVNVKIQGLNLVLKELSVGALTISGRVSCVQYEGNV